MQGRPVVPGPAAPSAAAPAIHLKPRLTKLLNALGLDVAYERGRGDFLTYRDDDGRAVEVLDLVGGYGSLLLGHAHPALVAEAQQLLASGRPVHAQGSRREPGERLARELARRAGGDYCAVFANSGAEAVEAALKHALLETGARTFLALEGAFHGKTLGAVQLTANPAYRDGFGPAGLDVVRVRPNDLAHLEAAFGQAGEVAGFFFEPVQGEGGVRPVEPAFARRAAELCAARGVPLIADECQTGLGRTGAFLACEALGVRPDYVVLSKALGGGLAKISALLIDRARYRDEFDLKHTSTYAEDDHSCTIALKALELIDEPLLARCRERGGRLLAGLEGLRERYPDVIAGVRGRGLLLGVEFRRLERSASFLLRFLAAQEQLGFLVAAYLFHAHRLRVAPTLSDPFTLRLQPSAFIGEADCRRVLDALDDVCRRLRDHDGPGLTDLLAGRGPAVVSAPLRPDWKPFARHEEAFRRGERRPAPARVAWLCHLIDADDLARLEPPFGAVPFHRREAYLGRFAALASPVVLSGTDVRSRTGAAVRLYAILLPVTSRWMKHWIDAGDLGPPQALVRQGIEAARALGCGLVALGQYTSIVTRNGTSLARPGLGLTTGNSYAIALACQALGRAHRERGSDPAEAVLAVAGAAGNVGRACAVMLAPRYRRTLLVGSGKPGSWARLRRLAGRLPNAAATTDLGAVAAADAVVAAMNAVDAPLGPDHFAPGAVVCDVSVPPSVRPETAAARPDLFLLKGGTVRLPCGEDLGIDGFPLPRGHTYGCMAEAILLGFEGVRDTAFTGALTPARVHRVAALARRHGFALADYKVLCVLGSERREVARGVAR